MTWIKNSKRKQDKTNKQTRWGKKELNTVFSNAWSTFNAFFRQDSKWAKCKWGQMGAGPHTDPRSVGPWEGPRGWRKDQSYAWVKWLVRTTTGWPDPLQKDKVLRFAAFSSNKKNQFFCRFMTHFQAENHIFSSTLVSCLLRAKVF